jgi:hypothetical protein
VGKRERERGWVSLFMATSLFLGEYIASRERERRERERENISFFVSTAVHHRTPLQRCFENGTRFGFLWRFEIMFGNSGFS